MRTDSRAVLHRRRWLDFSLLRSRALSESRLLLERDLWRRMNLDDARKS